MVLMDLREMLANQEWPGPLAYPEIVDQRVHPDHRPLPVHPARTVFPVFREMRAKMEPLGYPGQLVVLERKEPPAKTGRRVHPAQLAQQENRSPVVLGLLVRRVLLERRVPPELKATLDRQERGDHREPLFRDQLDPADREALQELMEKLDPRETLDPREALVRLESNV